MTIIFFNFMDLVNHDNLQAFCHTITIEIGRCTEIPNSSKQVQIYCSTSDMVESEEELETIDKGKRGE